jgi:N-terminal domain of anti-restriction factor ArdC
MAGRRRLTEAEPEQRRAQDRERLKSAAEQLLSSEGWQRWVRVRSRNGLARYSVSNQLLIAMACPQATFVAGFKAWLELGYCVRKGEKAIRLFAKRALSRLMQRSVLAASVPLRGRWVHRLGHGRADSSGVCGVGSRSRLLFCIGRDIVASDATGDRPAGRWWRGARRRARRGVGSAVR